MGPVCQRGLLNSNKRKENLLPPETLSLESGGCVSPIVILSMARGPFCFQKEGAWTLTHGFARCDDVMGEIVTSLSAGSFADILL